MDGLCDCGWPRSVCQDPENNGWFELSATTTVCEVSAVIEREQAERRKNSNYEPEPGERLQVVLNKPPESSILEGGQNAATEADRRDYQPDNDPYEVSGLEPG